MATKANLDERYYEVVSPGSLAERLAVRARDRIYNDFQRLCRPEPPDTILDVGVSDVITAAANFVERLYPYPERITAAGLGDATDFTAAFPAIGYVRIAANEGLPFADNHFSMAVSNAVLEHVGSEAHQRSFVAEMARVAHKVFITVPNRHFPVEHHTGIPLLHFWDRSFALSCRALGKDKWAQPQNLILMTPSRLRALAPAASKVVTGTSGLRFGPFSSNLYLYLES